MSGEEINRPNTRIIGLIQRLIQAIALGLMLYRITLNLHRTDQISIQMPVVALFVCFLICLLLLLRSWLTIEHVHRK